MTIASYLSKIPDLKVGTVLLPADYIRTQFQIQVFPFDSFLHIIGLLLAFIIGLSLGLLGSGGSAITVPVLVYFMGIAPTQAIPDSVFVVGVTSFAGALYNLMNKQVAWKPVMYLGIPSVIAALITRRFFVPLLPASLNFSSSIIISKDSYLMLLFAILLIIIARNMIRPRKIDTVVLHSKNILPAIIAGIVVGILIGLLGIGGGFLIVPVLVIYFNLDMKVAVGTSLWLITLNSLISFSADTSHEVYSWNFLLIYTFLTVIGMIISWSIAKKIHSDKLKVIAGYVILVIGILVIAERVLGNA